MNPIGGVKEKTMAGRRAGATTFIFPRANKPDFDKLPDHMKVGIAVRPLCHLLHLLLSFSRHFVGPLCGRLPRHCPNRLPHPPRRLHAPIRAYYRFFYLKMLNIVMLCDYTFICPLWLPPPGR